MTPVTMLDDEQVRELLDLDELRDALSAALVSLSGGEASVPPRVAAFAPSGLLGAMPGYVPGLGLAAKLVTVFPDNHRHGRPSHQAVIVAFDEGTGAPVAVLGATFLTAIRTGMTAALAARAVARPDSAVLAILGAGAQGEAHLTAFTRLFSLGDVRVSSRNGRRAAELASRHDAARAVTTFEQAVRGADIVCCCTDARQPIIDDRWIGGGTHVSSVGSGREIEPATIDRSAVFVESRAAVQPPPVGAPELQGMQPSTVTELGEVLAGRAPGRPSVDAVTVYKSTGHAVEDVAAAAVVLRRPHRSVRSRSRPAP